MHSWYPLPSLVCRGDLCRSTAHAVGPHRKTYVWRAQFSPCTTTPPSSVLPAAGRSSSGSRSGSRMRQVVYLRRSIVHHRLALFFTMQWIHNIFQFGRAISLYLKQSRRQPTSCPPFLRHFRHNDVERLSVSQNPSTSLGSGQGCSGIGRVTYPQSTQTYVE